MVYLDNLSSLVLKQGILPWDFKPVQPIPDEIRKDKKKRDAWINNPETLHHVYSCNEGVNGSARISTLKPDGSGNPVRYTDAIVSDYDHDGKPEAVLASLQSLAYPPNKVETTLSKHYRTLTFLEERITWPCHEFYVFFHQNFDEFAFPISQGWMGFDWGAFKAPERMYTNSCEWTYQHDNKIPGDVVRGWLYRAAIKFNFRDKSGQMAMPLDVAAAKLAELYTNRFHEWTAPFEVGQQGPSFFIEGSYSPKSSTLFDTGFYTFSAHATKSFYTWIDLFGPAFCKEYQDKAIGRAVKDIYHDGKYYFRQLPSGLWKPFEKADICGYLKASRGISVKPDKTGVSDMDRCIQWIHDFQSVEGAAPVIYRPSGLIYESGKALLNTSTLKPMQPSAGGIYGPDGNFPWLCSFYQTFFTTPEQLRYWLALHTYAYQAALLGKPCSGQAAILIGGTGIGKTFLGEMVYGRTLGGSVDAQRFMMGEERFGSQLFEVPVWLINDATVSTDPKKHRYYTEKLKKCVADPTHEYHKKFGIPSMVAWQGRIFITGNDDEESTRIIPNVGVSNLDKLMLFRCVHETSFKFPKNWEIKEILEKEGPNYCAWMRDQKIDKDLIGDSRFGIRCYHEPSLLRTAIQSSENAGFGEILDDWKKWYFTMDKKDAEYWEGTSVQLFKELSRDEATINLTRRLSPDTIGRNLAGLKNKGVHITSDDSGRTRVWRIYRD